MTFHMRSMRRENNWKGISIDHPPNNLEVGICDFREDCENYFDYSQRANWLRAVVLGGNEGLVLTSILIMGLGNTVHQTKEIIIKGLVGLVTGALSIAVAEYVSVYTQVDIVRAQEERNNRRGRNSHILAAPPSGTQVAVAAFIAYLVGGMMPLLITIALRDQTLRVLILAATTSVSMLGLGNFAAVLGKAPVARSCVRVLVGGWIEISLMLGKRIILEHYGYGPKG